MNVIGVAVPMLLAGAAAADVINVPGDFPTIQAAIDAAQDRDEVVVAPGTYNEAIDLLGKAITVRSLQGPRVTILDGAGLDESVVRCASGEEPDTRLEGFLITNGHADEGGGMYLADTSPTVVDCTFARNHAGVAGGGAWGLGGLPKTFVDCRFFDNTAAIGGGVYLAPATMRGCLLIGNVATEVGGAGVLGHVVTMIDCVIGSNDAAQEAGGLYVSQWVNIAGCIAVADSAH